MKTMIFALALLTLGLTAVACGGRAEADPDIRVHPKDVRGMPVLWLGEAFDSNGDGIEDMKLTSAYLKHTPELVFDGEVVVPEVKFYALNYGTCEIPPDATGCPVPISIDIADPCHSTPLARGIPKDEVAVRGMTGEVFGPGGSLRVETGEFTLVIHTVARNVEEGREQALRVANELRGANPEASHYGRDTAFKARMGAYLCK